MLQVPSDQLRYIIGGILAENDEPVDEDQKKGLIEDGYKIFQLPSVSYAVRTDFPYSCSLSIMIAVFRVYPKLNEYVKVSFLRRIIYYCKFFLFCCCENGFRRAIEH